MKQNKIYLVIGITGEYSDTVMWNEGAYKDKGIAETRCKYLNNLLMDFKVLPGTINYPNLPTYKKMEQVESIMRKSEDTLFSLDDTGTIYKVEEVDVKG